jgi:hypothetical protein
MIRKKILESAKRYVEQKEIKGNQGFIDKHFEAKMEAVGFEKGQAWCSYFAELVWCEGYGGYNSVGVMELQKLFSANAVMTYNRLVSAGYEASQTPEPGDLVVFQSYKQGVPRKVGIWDMGHIGIVSEVNEKTFKAIEGNTNSKGGREGIEVAEKTRRYNFDSNTGLRLIGFIKPKEII